MAQFCGLSGGLARGTRKENFDLKFGCQDKSDATSVSRVSVHQTITKSINLTVSCIQTTLLRGYDGSQSLCPTPMKLTAYAKQKPLTRRLKRSSPVGSSLKGSSLPQIGQGPSNGTAGATAILIVPSTGAATSRSTVTGREAYTQPGLQRTNLRSTQRYSQMD